MKIGLTSQNFRTITGHAGKARRFLGYTRGSDATLVEMDRLDLPREMSLHEFRGTDHPIDQFDVLITAGCGDGFKRRLATRGIRVLVTSETDPRVAAQAVLDDKELPLAEPHELPVREEKP